MTGPIRTSRGLAAAALLVTLVGCGGEEEPEPAAEPSSSATAASTAPTTEAGDVALEDAAAAFQAAEAAFQSEFDAAVAISAADDATLEERTESVRAVRTAYYNFDAALREIDVPADVAPDVNGVLTAIGALIAAFDVLGATTTQEAFDAANPAATEAFQAVDAALATLRNALGVANETAVPTETEAAPDEPVSTQTPVDAAYLDGATVTDAAAWRDDLLSIGAANVDPEAFASSYSFGIVEAWTAAFPTLLPANGVVGYQVEASPGGISGFTIFTVDDKDVPSADNPYFLAFAVQDADGQCAAGVLTGYPSPTEARPVELPSGADCTGASAASAADL